MWLKLTSTMPRELMTVQSRNMKPIHPSVPMLKLSMRSKMPSDISRACLPNSRAAIRLRSRSSSLITFTSASVETIPSSCPFSMFWIMMSIWLFIELRAQSSIPHVFAKNSRRHRLGTIESMEKYVSPAACIEQWLNMKPETTVLLQEYTDLAISLALGISFTPFLSVYSIGPVNTPRTTPTT